MTIGRRVIVGTSLALVAVAVLLSVFAYALVKHELYSRLDLTLRGRVAELTPTAVAGREEFRGVIAAPGELVQTVTARGRTVRPPYQVTVLPTGPDELAFTTRRGSTIDTIEVGGRRMRLVTSHIAPGEALQVARPLADDDATLRRLGYGFAISAVCALALAILLGGWIARTALSPIRRLTRAAEEVARTRDLSVRLDVEGDDEVARLGAAFNEMLEALDRSITAQRRLVADASHEFRTPLTSIRANAELLERGRVRESEQNDVARAVVEQVDELDGLVTDLIELALDGESATRFEDVRLDELAGVEVERMRRHAGGVRFELSAEPCSVRGDPERLARAIANVLGNALKWSADGDAVEVGVRKGVVVVRDHGPGFDEEDLPLVFERFYRATTARGTPGSGLGLAIVKHVVEAHGGTAEAANAPDGGAVLTLRLPPV